ncbi:delta-type opioid receptor-like [Chaetodon trifascialis]|uniref:delta-type opioid receptor-like n=1 Tax=Chaetodon trifascialis TaxID=109706 RepID=UPI003992AC08
MSCKLHQGNTTTPITTGRIRFTFNTLRPLICVDQGVSMESTPVEIFKEENKCLSTLLEDCSVNSSAWVSGYSDSRNVTPDDGWEQEGMSPIIPIITAVYSVVFVVGLLGNCLVMYVIIRYTKMKTATNIYIFNLALADALVTTTMPFQSTDYLLNTWPFGEVVCKVFISIDYYNMFTSIFTLTMMSVDRYVAVCHPVKALDFRTPIKAKMINVCIWILSSAAGIPAFVLGGTQTKSDITECALQFPEPYVYWDTLMKICVFVFAFVVPVLIITVCYSLMVLRLKSVRMLSGSREKDRNLRRITRLVVVVVAVFVVCWTPIHIFILVKALVSVPETTAIMAAYFFCVALGYTNSSLNPVLYAFLDENFKRCFKDFCLSAKLRGEKVSGSKKATSAMREAAVPLENPDGTSKPT